MLWKAGLGARLVGQSHRCGPAGEEQFRLSRRSVARRPPRPTNPRSASGMTDMPRGTYPSIPSVPFPVCVTALARFLRPRLLPQVPDLGAGPVRFESPRPVRDTVRTPLTLLYVQVSVC